MSYDDTQKYSLPPMYLSVSQQTYDSHVNILNERIKELMAEIAQYKADVINTIHHIGEVTAMVTQPKQVDTVGVLLEWVDGRIDAEVTHRPDQNIYKATLSQTWMQIRRKLMELKDDGSAAPPSPPIAERKDDQLRQQVIATLTAIGLPSVMMSGERACQLLRELLVAAQGIPPAIGQSIGHPIGHGEPVHDVGAEGQA